MNNWKRALACVIGLVVLATSFGVFAAKEEKVFRGYDVTDYAVASGLHAKIYDVYVNGIPTGKEVVEGYASKIEWKFDFYELAYPHLGYERLYLDGVYTSAYRCTNTIAPWAQEYRNDMWEVKYPYNIYQRLYTDVPGKGFVAVSTEFPEYENILFKFSGKEAKVTQEYKPFGFAQYKVNSSNDVICVLDEMSNFVNVQEFPVNFLTTANLSSRYDNGQYVISDYEIANSIQRYNSEFLTGPNYKTGGTKTIDTFSDCFENENPVFWYNQIVKESDRFVEVSWTDPAFEAAAPYAYYQYLVIDGVVMDGHQIRHGVKDEVAEYLPYIYRYTGGYASPKVEWKLDGVEAVWPHAAYERKYLTDANGKVVVTDDLRYNGEYGKMIGKAVYNQFTGKYDYKIWFAGKTFDVESDTEFVGDVSPTIDVSAPVSRNVLNLLNKQAQGKF